MEEIAHELAGATVYTKADTLKAFLQIHLTHEASLFDDVQLSSGTALILTDAFWSQNEPKCVPVMDGCHSRAVSRSHSNS